MPTPGAAGPLGVRPMFKANFKLGHSFLGKQLLYSQPFHKKIRFLKSILREYFPDVWFFKTVRLKKTLNQHVDEATVQLAAPDSITTWKLNTVCLTRGLGIWTPPHQSPTQIKVFHPFFIDFRSPQHAKRTETLTLPVTLFFVSTEFSNLLEDCFEIALSIHVNATEWSLENSSEIIQCICGHDARSIITFKLKALEVGNLNVTVKAVGMWGTPLCSKNGTIEDRAMCVAQDAMRRSIRVVAEGVERCLVDSKFFCTKSGKPSFLLNSDKHSV